jgi:hypothetical protein
LKKLNAKATSITDDGIANYFEIDVCKNLEYLDLSDNYE